MSLEKRADATELVDEKQVVLVRCMIDVTSTLEVVGLYPSLDVAKSRAETLDSGTLDFKGCLSSKCSKESPGSIPCSDGANGPHHVRYVSWIAESETMQYTIAEV